MSDPQTILGKIITDDLTVGRDAVHIAVVPMYAAEDLKPRDRVGFAHIGNEELAGRARRNEGFGIVDPFLEGAVRKGQRFWVYLFPNTITGLRHEWTHPAFSQKTATDEVDKRRQASVDWITSYGMQYDISFEELIETARNVARGDHEYICRGGELEGEYVPDEFWEHFQIVTGIKVDEDHRQSFFSCAC